MSVTKKGSTAFSSVLEPLLTDVRDIVGAHQQGRTGRRGRQWNLSGLNRAIVVMAVAAWEAYVEELAVEAVDLLRPARGPLGPWPALRAAAAAARSRFNTPNLENVRILFQGAIGLEDVSSTWSWKGTSRQRATVRLAGALKYRHQIAHGARPRPTINHSYASRLPGFFRQLASCTDQGVRQHLVGKLGVVVPW